MKKVDFLAKVKEEANHLKNALTSEQKAMLDYSKLNPHFHTGCLLGQIFGSHDSDEAIAVLPKSVRTAMRISYSEARELRDKPETRLKFSELILTTERLISTYLEAFLVLDVNSEDLFKFIKGEVETFEPIFFEVFEDETL
jgi:hypothetical protein